MMKLSLNKCQKGCLMVVFEIEVVCFKKTALVELENTLFCVAYITVQSSSSFNRVLSIRFILLVCSIPYLPSENIRIEFISFCLYGAK